MDRWLNSPVGKSVIQAETAALSEVVPSGFYARSLQIGISGISYLGGIEASERYIVDVNIDHSDGYSKKPSDGYFMKASPHALPFPERSQNLIVLPHTLDHCGNPHDVLREVDQILEPEGCLAIIGFNKYSLYGSVHVFMSKTGKMPWNGKFYSVGRVQDWLLLLGYDLVGARMLVYRPPISSERYHAKLQFLEKAGNRWWPGLGSVYMIIGKKREIMLMQRRQLSPAWTKFLPSVVQPAPQRVARCTNSAAVNE